MAWLQCFVDVSGDRADAVATHLEAAGALSVTMLDAADQPLLEPAPGARLCPPSALAGPFGQQMMTELVRRREQPPVAQ